MIRESLMHFQQETKISILFLLSLLNPPPSCDNCLFLFHKGLISMNPRQQKAL